MTVQNFSVDFTATDFAGALQNTKSGKAYKPDSICLDLIILAGDALKSWFRGFLSSCLRHLRLPPKSDKELL